MAGETAIGCCPTGYGCNWVGGQHTCVSTATSTTIDAMTCSGTTMLPKTGFAIPFAADSITISSMLLYAPMIQLVHQATDLPVTTSSVSSTSTPSGSAQSSKYTYFEPSKGLSKTEIAGVVVASIMFLICLVAVIFFVYMRRKRAKFAAEAAVKREQIARESPEPGPPVLGDYPPPPPGAASLNDPQNNRNSEYKYTFPNSPRPATVADMNRQSEYDDDRARIGRSLGPDDDLESPIDGTSPFRLKRGNTLKRLFSLRKSRDPERSVSPLATDSSGPDEWDRAIESGGLTRNVSAVTEPAVKKQGRVPEHMPETHEGSKLGRYESQKATMGVAGVAM